MIGRAAKKRGNIARRKGGERHPAPFSNSSILAPDFLNLGTRLPDPGFGHKRLIWQDNRIGGQPQLHAGSSRPAVPGHLVAKDGPSAPSIWIVLTPRPPRPLSVASPENDRRHQRHDGGKDSFAGPKLAEQRVGMNSLGLHGAAHMAPFMPLPMQEIGTSMHRAASRLAIVLQDTEPAQAHLCGFHVEGRSINGPYRGWDYSRSPQVRGNRNSPMTLSTPTSGYCHNRRLRNSARLGQ